MAINVSRDFQTAEPGFGGLEFDTLIPFDCAAENVERSMLPAQLGGCRAATYQITYTELW